MAVISITDIVLSNRHDHPHWPTIVIKMHAFHSRSDRLRIYRGIGEFGLLARQIPNCERSGGQRTTKSRPFLLSPTSCNWSRERQSGHHPPRSFSPICTSGRSCRTCCWKLSSAWELVYLSKTIQRPPTSSQRWDSDPFCRNYLYTVSPLGQSSSRSHYFER